jgi:hypothetical protein
MGDTVIDAICDGFVQEYLKLSSAGDPWPHVTASFSGWRIFDGFSSGCSGSGRISRRGGGLRGMFESDDRVSSLRRLYNVKFALIKSRNGFHWSDIDGGAWSSVLMILFLSWWYIGK